MAIDTFDAFYQQLQELYQSGEFERALDLATLGLEHYPENRTVLDYWRMTMAARTGDEDLTLLILQEALDRGEWYSELLLRRSPSFRSMQDNPQFARLVLLNQEVAESDHQHELPLLILRPQNRCQSGGEGCPLLLGLHGNANTAHSALPFWAGPAAAGWLVAAPQSSQAIWKGAYVWDNRELAEQDVQRHFATLRETYAVDPRRVVVGGHAMGGEIAIWLALRTSIDMRGFIAIGPGGPFMDDIEEWEPLLNEKLPPDLRGAILIGKEDSSIPHENIRKLATRLNEAGVNCHLEVIPYAGHEHTPDYDPAILRALKFLTA